MATNINSFEARETRRKYVNAFNHTMVKIWQEQIVKLNVIRTGLLYRSVLGTFQSSDADYIDITLGQQFRTYGLFVDYGTGSNTPRGNSGDLGAGFTNRRKRKRWFSKKYYASVMNIRDFYADIIGKEAALAVSNALNPDNMRKSVTTP
jgi:hypothetical protein